MRQRITEELALLRRAHGEVEHVELNGEDWFRLPAYPFPPGWRLGETELTTAAVVFKLGPTYPTAQPYAFCIPAGVTCGGAAPNNSTVVPAAPFTGTWLQLSWQPDGDWAPTDKTDVGSNLLSWVRSFAQRLKEGV